MITAVFYFCFKPITIQAVVHSEVVSDSSVYADANLLHCNHLCIAITSLPLSRSDFYHNIRSASTDCQSVIGQTGVGKFRDTRSFNWFSTEGGNWKEVTDLQQQYVSYTEVGFEPII